jgi:hypothetical protein
MAGTGRLDRRKLDDLVDCAVDPVCAWVNGERDTVQVDEVREEIGHVLAECTADFVGGRGAERFGEGFGSAVDVYYRWAAVPEGFQIGAYSVGYLEDFEFVA